MQAKNGAGQIEESDQTALQARFECFFVNLDTLTFEKPTVFPNRDSAEVTFTEMMDKKYRQLGFKP
jgi:hypothetical protein